MLLGGFEASGHDSHLQALAESAPDKFEIFIHCWPDSLPTDNLVFNLHRLPVEDHPADVAGVLDSPAIPIALHADLHQYLEIRDFDAVISVHPWSTVIAGLQKGQLDRKPLLVDVHGEFSHGPLGLVRSPEVDLYVGLEFAAPAPRSVVKRTRLTGVPARPNFTSDGSRLRNEITVNIGHGAWALKQSISEIQLALSTLTPTAINVVGKAPDDLVHVAKDRGVPIVERRSASHIADGLLASSVAISKASGSMVAECLATETPLVCPKSGVFWEDDARALLCAEQIVAPSVLHFLQLRDVELLNTNSHAIGRRCRSAARTIWAIVDHNLDRGVFDRTSESLPSQLNQSVNISNVANSQDPGLLPNATEALASLIDAWLDP